MIVIEKHIYWKISFAFGAMLLITSPVYSQVASTIQTPPASAVAALSSEKSLHELALANLVASNCEINDVTKGDAALIGGTAQAVASHMNLTMDVYISNYVQPAMMKLATPTACEEHEPMTSDVLQNIKDLGGTVLN